MNRIIGLFCCSLALLLISSETPAQSCPQQIRGGWESEFALGKLLEISLLVQAGDNDRFSAKMLSASGAEELAIRREGQYLRLQSTRLPVSFEGRLSDDRREIAGFVTFASNLYRLSLVASSDNSWSSTWNPLPVGSEPVKLDLYFDGDGDGGTAGYFFFRDQRLPGLYGFGTHCNGRDVEVGEKNLGLNFKGEFAVDYSRLGMAVRGPAGTTAVAFTPMSGARSAMSPGQSAAGPRRDGQANFPDRAPEKTGDGWPTEKPSAAAANLNLLREMVKAVAAGEFALTHSILVAKSGELLVEEYFHGYDRSTLHDMRSASKSIASTLVGLAVDSHLIDSAESPVLPFFPEYPSYDNWIAAKADIRLRDLLTMSSGLDANDSDRDSVAGEGTYQSQMLHPDWIKLALDAPMIAEPGTRHIYGSANPLILGGVLDNVAGRRLEWFAQDKLFGPLGIEHYRIYLDPTGVPYLGGGMYLRPRDMLKIGQMYLDGGRWQGRQVLSASWVTESFGKYGRLEPLERNGNEYGYLWWHETYAVNGEAIESIEARGNGGQYIFVVPELELTAVITSGNYRGGLQMTRQPEAVFEKFILPAFVHAARETP